MLTKIRRAIELLKGGRSSAEWSAGRDAEGEADAAEKTLREAMALKTFAAAGLSAFHGNLCSMAPGAHPVNPEECADPKCRAWAAAVKGEAGPEAIWNAALERVAEDFMRRSRSALVVAERTCDSESRAEASDIAQRMKDEADYIRRMKKEGPC